MNNNNLLQIQEHLLLWFEHSDSTMNTTLYCGELGLSDSEILYCTDPNAKQKICLTEHALYHYVCGMAVKINLDEVSQIEYKNKVISITNIQGKNSTYCVDGLVNQNTDCKLVDQLGVSITFVLKTLSPFIK